MKANYLKGLSHVLNHLPKPVLVTELPTVRASLGRGDCGSTECTAGSYSCLLCLPHPQLLSLLLEALSCSDRVVQLSTLSCLQPLLLEAPQIMSLHVDTLVTKFLSLASSPTMVRVPPLSLPTPLSSAPAPSAALTPVCLFQAVRIAALRCAHALTSLPTTVVSAPRSLLLHVEGQGGTKPPPGGQPAPSSPTKSPFCPTAAPIQGPSYPGAGQAFG